MGGQRAELRQYSLAKDTFEVQTGNAEKDWENETHAPPDLVMLDCCAFNSTVPFSHNKPDSKNYPLHGVVHTCLSQRLVQLWPGE